MSLLRRLAPLHERSPSRLVRFAMINGLPGFVSLEADGHLQTTAFDVIDGKIARIYIMRNPDKLGHLSGEVLH